MNDWYIRPIEQSELPFLKQMLYTALYVGEGDDPFPSDIVDQPVWSKWYTEWGRQGDIARVATVDDSLLGACWTRLFDASNPGYGYVADNIPELTIAIKDGSRGMGIGTGLLQSIIESVRNAGYRGLSLSIDGRNHGAQRLYERHGFRIVKEAVNPTMLLLLAR